MIEDKYYIRIIFYRNDRILLNKIMYKKFYSKFINLRKIFSTVIVEI